MNSAVYSNILINFLVPFGQEAFDNQYFLHQDNSPIHNSVECMEVIEREQIKVVLLLRISLISLCIFLLIDLNEIYTR